MVSGGGCDYPKIQALLTELFVSLAAIMTHSEEAGQTLAWDPMKLSLNPGQGTLSASISVTGKRDRRMGTGNSELLIWEELAARGRQGSTGPEASELPSSSPLCLDSRNVEEVKTQAEGPGVQRRGWSS